MIGVVGMIAIDAAAGIGSRRPNKLCGTFRPLVAEQGHYVLRFPRFEFRPPLRPCGHPSVDSEFCNLAGAKERRQLRFAKARV